MIELTVTNMTGVAAGQAPTSFTVNGDFPTLTDIKDAIKAETGIENQDQLLLHDGRLIFGDEENICTRFNLSPTPAITLHRRLPDAETITVVLRPPFRLPILICYIRAKHPVVVLKNFLARWFGMAPWKQLLVALEAPMLEAEKLSSYATSTTVEVSFSELSDGSQPQQFRIIVVDPERGTEVTVVVERRDTVDVLQWRLASVGMIQKCENPRFFRGDEQLVSGKSFEEYELPGDCLLQLVREGN